MPCERGETFPWPFALVKKTSAWVRGSWRIENYEFVVLIITLGGFSVLIDFSSGFSVLVEILAGFLVSERPQCPLSTICRHLMCTRNRNTWLGPSIQSNNKPLRHPFTAPLLGLTFPCPLCSALYDWIGERKCGTCRLSYPVLWSAWHPSWPDWSDHEFLTCLKLKLISLVTWLVTWNISTRDWRIACDDLTFKWIYVSY